MRLTESRVRALLAERTAVVSFEQAGAFMQLRRHQVQHLVDRGVLPVARSAAGEPFVIGDYYQTIEVDTLRRVLAPRERQALEGWLSGAYETPKAAVAAAAAIAHDERLRERSDPEGAR